MDVPDGALPGPAQNFMVHSEHGMKRSSCTVLSCLKAARFRMVPESHLFGMGARTFGGVGLVYWRGSGNGGITQQERCDEGGSRASQPITLFHQSDAAYLRFPFSLLQSSSSRFKKLSG